MTQNKHNNQNGWFWAALVALLFAAPNPMIIRIFVAESIDPFFWVFARAFAATVISVPFTLCFIRRVSWSHRVLLRMVFIGMLMSVAIIAHTKAIQISSASYVSIITLIYPIVLIGISALLFREMITRRILASIGFGVMGSLVLLVVPLLVSRGSMEFNGWATVLSVMNLVLFACATAMMRQLSNRHVPLIVQIAISSCIMTLLSGVFVVLTGAMPAVALDTSFWVAVVYSGGGVMVVTRLISTMSYIHVGAATVGILNYVEAFLAIILPVVVLGENVSITMVIGGALILAGVYILEHRKRQCTG